MRSILTLLLAICCFGCSARNERTTALPATVPPEPVNLIPEALRLSESEQYPGQNDLVGKVGTSDLAGRVQILDHTIDTDDPSHAEAVKQVVMNAGVPEERVSVQGERYIQREGQLTVPSDTRVIVRPLAPPYEPGDGEVLARHNIIAVASAGNIEPEDGGNRDLWSAGHPRWPTRREHAMRSLRNADGKALLATWAEVGTERTIPVQKAAMCGDAMEWCFAVRVPPNLLQFVRDAGATSSAAPILGAHTFYLFQLWDTAEEVFGVLKECAYDAGDPGVDREFGLGIPTAICETVQDREVQTAGASLSFGSGSAVVSSLLAGPGSSVSLGSDVSLSFSPVKKAPDLFVSFSSIAVGKTVQRGATTLSALAGVGYAPLGVSSYLTRRGHSLFAEAGMSREVLSGGNTSLSFLGAVGADTGPVSTLTGRVGTALRHRSFSLYGGAVHTTASVPIPGHEAVGVPPAAVSRVGWELTVFRSFSFGR